ncbi:cystathionine beta-lyase [Aquibaculum sediminis]|uniref:cystathionine beta-lyase n=1 Tax=Aquibaculum sediminis TaxID=3231907 RepID=UPI003452ADD7
MSEAKKAAPQTRLAHAGRRLACKGGHPVNPPVVRASTILFDSVEELLAVHSHRLDPEFVSYGRNGTETSFSLEHAVAELEGGAGCVAVGSGLAAITVAILSQIKQGDHLLVADSVYAPTRKFCDGLLARFGVETTYYDPLIGAGIAERIRPNTRVIFLEAPGSLTFEIQDVPAITKVARDAGVTTIMDNTWATPLFFQPLAHGVDISVHAGTKYVVGHSDAMLGLVIANEAQHDAVRQQAQDLGHGASPDDAWLGLRGLRTMAVRLAQHQTNALKVAEWLQGRPEVARVLYPALPSDPGHAIWKRDFCGASGLMGVELHPVGMESVADLLEGLQFFGMGYSWGGYESLAIPTFPAKLRSTVPWTAEGPLLRLHIGLEDPADLIADLEAGFDRLRLRAAAE